MADELNDEELDQIAARLEAATSTPWKAYVEGRDHDSGDDFIRTASDDDSSADMYVTYSSANGNRPAGADDLDFIAHAPDDIRRLLRAVAHGSSTVGTATDPTAEAHRGRVALWLDPEDLEWLSRHCGCADDADTDTTERCARVRFRSSAALHKAGLR